MAPSELITAVKKASVDKTWTLLHQDGTTLIEVIEAIAVVRDPKIKAMLVSSALRLSGVTEHPLLHTDDHLVFKPKIQVSFERMINGQWVRTWVAEDGSFGVGNAFKGVSVRSPRVVNAEAMATIKALTTGVDPTQIKLPRGLVIN
jgi:hypothetical protein